ncbi:hypothetical protein ACWDTG_02045 [Rhodococcus zopfii]
MTTTIRRRDDLEKGAAHRSRARTRSLASLRRARVGDVGSAAVAVNPVHLLFVTLAAFAVYAIPLSFVGQFRPTALMVLSVAAVVVATVLTMAIGAELFVVFWLALAYFQNFAVGTFVPGHVDLVPVYISESKTVAIVSALALMFPTAMTNLKRYRPPVIWYGLFALVVVGHVASLGGATLPYLRNFLIPLATVLLIVAITAQWSEERRSDLLRVVVRYSTAVLTIGTFAEALVGSSAWRSMVNVDKNGALNSLSSVTSFLGIQIDRTGGFIVEPTNAGYIAAAVIIIATLVSIQGPRSVRAGMYVCIALCGWVLISSGAKSGLLMLLVASISGVTYARSKRVWGGLLGGWSISLLVVLVYVAVATGPGKVVSVFTDPLGIVGGDSTTYHLAGLVAGMKHAVTEFVGAGIGNGGNFARIAGAPISRWILTGGESSWGVLAYQAGILGIVLFAATVASLCKHLGRRSAVLLSAWTSAAMFAEALFGPQAAGLIVVAAALFMTVDTDNADESASGNGTCYTTEKGDEQ